MLRVLTVFFGMVLLCPSPGSASDWLLIPTDVRSRALGNTSTALPGLAFALDANPALLTQTKIGNGGLSLGKIQDLYSTEVDLFSAYGTVGSHFILDRIALGVAFRQLKSTQLSFGYANPYGPSGGYDVHYNRAYMLGLGIVISENASAGITMKHLTFSSSDGLSELPAEWEWDCGLYFENLLPGATFGSSQDAKPGGQVLSSLALPRARGLSLGVAVQNFGNRASSSGNEVKLAGTREVLTIGVSYLPLLTRRITILAVAELSLRDPLNGDPLDPRSGDEMLRWGVEAGAYRLLDLRLGMELDVATGDFIMTSGMGLGPERLRINYSFYWHRDHVWTDLPRFGLTVRF